MRVPPSQGGSLDVERTIFNLWMIITIMMMMIMITVTSHAEEPQPVERGKITSYMICELVAVVDFEPF